MITIPDVPSGGTIHVATKALGRVNGGASCTTPNCILIVQGRTPTSGIGKIVILFDLSRRLANPKALLQ